MPGVRDMPGGIKGLDFKNKDRKEAFQATVSIRSGLAYKTTRLGLGKDLGLG